MNTPYTQRFIDAFALAAQLHAEQRKKSSGVPYIAHLLEVCAIVWTDGGDEDEAIAALLHDAIEDHGDKIDLDELRARFGERVAMIVDVCTDTVGQAGTLKPPWLARKRAHLRHLEDAPVDALRVVAADKFANARAIVDDRRFGSPAVWARFNGGALGTAWYYQQMAELLTRRLVGSRLPSRLAEMAAELAEAARADVMADPDANWVDPEGAERISSAG
ncbi:MAG: HD domain-containing protein [Acidimicrobiales bacterium]|nr:HD domain-containing protein [Acidimicrobiales bacterium]